MRAKSSEDHKELCSIPKWTYAKFAFDKQKGCSLLRGEVACTQAHAGSNILPRHSTGHREVPFENTTLDFVE